MNYRDMLGFPKKQPKNKVAPVQPKPSIADKLKEEFGPLNEWTKKPPSEKRWSGAYQAKDGLTEFERKGGKDNVNEGPAYEYAPYIKKIDKLYDEYWDAVKDFQKLLDKKGLKGASKGIGNAYKNLVLKFHKLFGKIVDKLM